MRRLRPALVLLGVAILAYGLLIPQMGFYWDELPMTWIRYELGPAAMTRYFSTNRPVWGLLYQVTTRLLPQIPIYWQVFGLLWRWLTAVLTWAIVRELWPGRERLALITSLLFLVYPGFNQQWTAYLYSHFFIVLCFLLGSFLCMLRAFRYSRRDVRFWLLTAGALVLSALNLWMMEYFFVLELLRPFLIFHFVSAEQTEALTWARIRRTLVLWGPYLAVFAANVLWRLFIFNNQIYQPTLIPKIKAAPLAALWDLLKTVLADLYKVSIEAWLQVFHFPSPSSDGPRTSAVLPGGTCRNGRNSRRCIFLQETAGGGGARPQTVAHHPRLDRDAGCRRAILVDRAGHHAGSSGQPLHIAIHAGRKPAVGGRAGVAAEAHWIGVRGGADRAGSGTTGAYLRTPIDVTGQRRKRCSGKCSGARRGSSPTPSCCSNEGPLQFYADNSLTGALNWIYDPVNHSGAMDYALFFPTSRAWRYPAGPARGAARQIRFHLRGLHRQYIAEHRFLLFASGLPARSGPDH